MQYNSLNPGENQNYLYRDYSSVHIQFPIDLMPSKSEKKYHIIFINKLIKDVPIEEARTNLINTFQLSPQSSQRLFSAKTACLSKTDIEANANKAVELIRNIGFEAKILSKRPRAKSLISASMRPPKAENTITRHIESLKPRALKLKEKITLFTEAYEKGWKYVRGIAPPIPENPDDYLNPAQRQTIEKMMTQGWALFFIRRSDPSEPITMMIFPTTGETAQIEQNGDFNKHHQIEMRH